MTAVSCRPGPADARDATADAASEHGRSSAPPRDRRIGALLMVGSAAAWALGLVASKEALQRTGGAPVLVLTGQLAASVVALTAACAIRRTSVRPALGDGWSGLLEPGLAYQLSLAGLALTSAASATVIASMEPIFVPLLAWVVLRRRPRARLVVTGVSATIGAAVVTVAGTSTDGHSVTGDALVLGSVVAAAAYVVVSAAAVDRQTPLALALAQQLWALALTVGVAAIYLGAGGSPGERLTAWAAAVVAGSGVLNYALPFTLYLAALTRIDVTTAAQYLTLIPVFGVVGAVTLLGDAVSAGAIVGTTVIVASLAVAVRTPAPV